MYDKIRFHRRHADPGRGIDHRDHGCNLAEHFDRPLQLIDIVECFSADDRLGLLRLLDQLVDPLPGQITERQLQIHLVGIQIALLRQLAEPVELLRHPAQDFLQEVLAEVPVVHFEVDVFLNDRMAGLTEDGGEGGKAEIGFGGIPVRREDQHDLHLPAAGGFGGLAMEQDQFFGGPFALRILNPHTGLILSATADDKKQSESQGVSNKRGYCTGAEPQLEQHGCPATMKRKLHSTDSGLSSQAVPPTIHMEGEVEEGSIEARNWIDQDDPEK